ncbi:MAG TPA: ABC transporter permease [Solirubrobacterales bacterium]|jgi:ABC transporter DrrB family efflux protein
MSAAVQLLHESRLLAGRSLRQIPRVPERLTDVTVMPVIFVLTFVYVFGSAITLPEGIDYHEYLVSGMFAQGIGATLGGLAVGVASDHRSGLFDRLRALPISRLSQLAGRNLAQLVEGLLGTAVLVVLGLIVGWAPHGTVLETIAAFALLNLWAFAGAWLGTWIGLIVREPEAANQLAFLIFFPLMFLSGIFVPVTGLPTPLRQIAEWNPLSAAAAASRELFHTPSPPTTGAWPQTHPVLATILLSGAMIAVFAPLAVRRYRRLG